MIVLPGLLFSTAPGIWAGADDHGAKKRPPGVGSMVERAVAAGTTAVGGTALPAVGKAAVIPPAAPAKPVAMPLAKPRPSQTGVATWYGAPKGTCAHTTLPMGTVIVVTRLGTATTTTCRVADRGPFGVGRVVDLSKDTFAKLGDPSAGELQVRLQW
jgi:rare lipoprotein A